MSKYLRFNYPQNVIEQKEILPLIDVITSIPGLTVTCSTWRGYGEGVPLIHIWFKADKIENLEVISRTLSLRYNDIDDWSCRLSDTEKEAGMLLTSGAGESEKVSLIMMEKFIDGVYRCLETPNLVEHFNLDETELVTREELKTYVVTQRHREIVLKQIV